jgi:proteasome lid subunit RPN8/RPN11
MGTKMSVSDLNRVDDEVRAKEPAPLNGTWSANQCPWTIAWSGDVLQQIRQEVEDNSQSLPATEVGGVLFGVLEPGGIRIVAYKPLPCEHAFGPGFVLSQNDEERMAQIIVSAKSDRNLDGLQAVGWYHSHIYSKISLSERDLKFHSRHFPAPFHVAVVLRPSAKGPTRAGFFFREPSGAMRTESSYEEFTLQSAPSGLTPSPDAQPARVPYPGRGALAPKPAEGAPLACPKCGCKQLRRSHRANVFERLAAIFGYYPYRCHECLSRSLLKTSTLLDSIRPSSYKRHEERTRAWLRTRREVLLWGAGILCFLIILYYLLREKDPESDQP